MSCGILEGLYELIPGEDPVDPGNFPGVLDADPQFVDPIGADGRKGNEDDDLHLGFGSPAIDSGDNTAVAASVTTDIDGDQRFQDDPATADTGKGTAPIVDMGAYEFAGIAGDNIPPVASASATPSSGVEPLYVQFSSVGSGDTDGQFVIYSWDFDNGSSSNQADPWFSYPFAGVYTAVLTVTDDLGATRTDSVIINVTEPVTNQAPVALASADPATGEAPLSVTFYGSLSYDDSLIVSYSWDFGDGAYATGETVQHTYGSGTYAATLTVTDDQDATGMTMVSITAVDPATPPAGNTAPAAPTNLAVALVKTGKGKNKVVTDAILNWMDNSDDETGFIIERCLEQTTGKGKKSVTTCDFSQYGVMVDANPTSLSIPTATSLSIPTDSGYRYRVKAVNDAGDSAYTNEVSI
jgi:PKD repeat protein